MSAPAAAAAAPAEAKADEKKVDISGLVLAFIPGTGNMGFKLARNHAKAGNKVILSSRDASKATGKAEELKKLVPGAKVETATHTAAATAADVIFFTASGSLEDRAALLHSIAANLEGKIVVDITNIGYLPYFADKWGQISSTELCIAAIAPHTAKWTCAYKSTFEKLLDAPVDASGRGHGVLIGGDDATATATVRALVASTGFHPLDVGALKNIRIVELMAPRFVFEMTTRNTGGKVGSWRFEA